MTPVYNDGSVPYGSFAISNLTRAGVVNTNTFILENFTVTRPTKKTLRPDQLGQPNGFVLVTDQATASGVWQIPIAGANFPALGDYFSITVDANIGAEKWVIETIGQPYEMNGYYKQNVTFLKTYLS